MSSAYGNYIIDLRHAYDSQYKEFYQIFKSRFVKEYLDQEGKYNQDFFILIAYGYALREFGDPIVAEDFVRLCIHHGFKEIL